jgi:uncharacterized membrane protein YraQ (UPF0718 family)
LREYALEAWKQEQERRKWAERKKRTRRAKKIEEDIGDLLPRGVGGLKFERTSKTRSGRWPSRSPMRRLISHGGQVGAANVFRLRLSNDRQSECQTRAEVRDIVGRVWLYIVVGIAVGAGIHGYVPEDFMASFMGKGAWWSVPLAVLLGIPMYSNAAGIVPVVHALLEKGAALGTVLAFMMSVIALSLPEMIILRKVLKLKLIATFIAVVGVGILIVGYLFNLLL